MRRLRLPLAFSFLLLAAAHARAGAPASLVVRVRDPHGAPVPRTDAWLTTRDGRVRHTASGDEAGRCRFDRVQAGEYLLEARAPGFARSRAIAVSARAGAAAEVDVSLSAAAFEERLVVTASGTLQTGDETAKAVGVLDAHTLDAHGEVWLADAVRGVPGLYVQQLGGPGAFASVKARGLRNEDTAVLVDGVPFRDAAAPQGDASGFLGEMPLANVDRVEVLRGSGSSLHGSHAVGGALNLITRGGAGPASGQVMLETGGLGLARGRAFIAGRPRGDGVSGSLGVTHLDVTRGLDAHDAVRQSGVQGRADVRLPGNAELSASLFGVDARSMINESPSALGTLPPSGVIEARPGVSFAPAADDPDNRRVSRFLSGRVAITHGVGTRLGYSLAYHHVTTTRTYLDGPQGITAFEPADITRSQYDGRRHTLAARVDGRWSPFHLTTASYELDRETYAGRSVPVSPASESSVDVTQRSHTLFVQHQAQPASRLHVTAAVRAQSFALRTPAFSPFDRAPYQGIAFTAPPAAYTADGAAAYRMGTGTKLHAHAGNGYRAPSLFERFGTFFGSFGYSVYGDPRLGPERSLAWDAGVDQELASGRLRASATYFHARLRKVIAFETLDSAARAADPFGRSRGYRNADGRPARGIELGLQASLRAGLQLGASYTFTDAEPRQGQPADLPQAYAVPRHVGAARARYRSGRWQLAADVHVASAHLTPLFDPATFTSRAFRFAGRVDADVVASYTMPLGGRARVRAFGKVGNLTDSKSYEQGFAVPGRVAFAGAAFEL